MEITSSYRYWKRIQKVNILIYGIMALQMFLVPLISGMIALEYFPLMGIYLVLVFVCGLAMVLITRPIGKFLMFLTNFISFGLMFYWLILFSGPFDRMLQVVFILGLLANIFAISLEIVAFIKKILQKNKENKNKTDIQIEKNFPKIAKILAVGFIFSLIFTGLAVFDFGRVYHLKAAENFQTRSSFWGSPNYDKTLVESSIVPLDSTHLIIENSSLSAPYSNLKSGGIMYVESVSHNATPGINYCDYYQGAESYPNGTVILSSALPNLSNVSIRFYYMENVKVFEYLVQSNSRLNVPESLANQSWVDADNIFWNLDRTYEFLMFEHWNISYYIMAHVEGFVFTHIYNYNAFTARGHAILDFVNKSRDLMPHCLGISFDFEPKDEKDPLLNPDWPDLPDPITLGLVSESKWLKLNEQNDEVLNAAKTAYFNLFDHAVDLGLKTYAIYVNWAMEDLADGDLDYNRLPVWIHPDVEYGTMSYQSKEDDDLAPWAAYWMEKNQQTMYGAQGMSMLTGWLTDDVNDRHAQYYTNDETGLERYIRDIKVHQAAGAKELFHAPLFGMQLKWGDEAIMRVYEALNEDPKEEITFRAEPWGHFDTTLYDLTENFNHLWLGLPSTILILFFLVGLDTKLHKKLRTSKKV